MANKSDKKRSGRIRNLFGFLTWSLNEDTLTIKGKGEMSDYNRYKTKTVPWISSRKSITTVIIEDGVTSIGDAAFFDCTSLTSIVIPNSVTSIGNYAFNTCSSLTSIIIPDGVTHIGNSAFFDCSNLTSILIPNGITTIKHCTFLFCSGLTSITIPDSVTTIGNYAFSDCSMLISAIIPDSVKEIGDGVFVNCSMLTSVTIGSSVTNIGRWVFRDCTSLKHLFLFCGNPPQAYYDKDFEDEDFNEHFKTVRYTCILHVPAGCKEKYANADGWKKFKNIEEN